MLEQASAPVAIDALIQHVKRIDWQDMSLTAAAQTVQVSAYPDAYAKHESRATTIVNAFF